MTRLALLAAAALVLAGCGGGGGGGATRADPVPPRLPRALAQTWAQQADAVAAALAAGDGCTAERLAGRLRAEVAGATGRAPRRLLAPVESAVDELAGRITCTPPPAPVTTQETPTQEEPKHEKPKHEDHPKPPPPKKPHEHDHKKKEHH